MRVPRTFVFVDLSGFTNYTASHGDDAAGRVLATFRAIVREVASDIGVRIAKWLGDGCMVVAVDPLDAITFAVELSRRCAAPCAPLTVRAGIASGRALLFEGDDYIGASVNMASRLCDAAAAFEILMPADQLGDLPSGVDAHPHHEMVLRGLPEPVPVVNLVGRVSVPEHHDTGELWTRSPFAV